jgi:hypothetical protein
MNQINLQAIRESIHDGILDAEKRLNDAEAKNDAEKVAFEKGWIEGIKWIQKDLGIDLKV